MGPVRISLPVELLPYNWGEWRARSGCPRLGAVALAGIARELGSSVRQWRCTFDTIPVSAFVEVYLWDGSEWEGFWDQDYLQTLAEAAPAAHGSHPHRARAGGGRLAIATRGNRREPGSGRSDPSTSWRSRPRGWFGDG